jgi:hypothetical protein
VKLIEEWELSVKLLNIALFVALGLGLVFVLLIADGDLSFRNGHLVRRRVEIVKCDGTPSAPTNCRPTQP